MPTHFNEEQRFTQWWLWLILIPIGIFPVIGIFKQLILGEDFGDKPMSDFGLILFEVLVFAILGLFLIMRLKTEIDQTEIRMIRLSFKYGTVYNIKGNKGLSIELRNGKKFVIGTQRETELKKNVKKFMLFGSR